MIKASITHLLICYCGMRIHFNRRRTAKQLILESFKASWFLRWNPF
jgi:hypothetical protein